MLPPVHRRVVSGAELVSACVISEAAIWSARDGCADFSTRLFYGLGYGWGWPLEIARVIFRRKR